MNNLIESSNRQIPIMEFAVYAKLTTMVTPGERRHAGIRVSVHWADSEASKLGTEGSKLLEFYPYDPALDDRWSDVEAAAINRVSLWILHAFPLAYGLTKREIKDRVNGIFTRRWRV